MHRTKNYITIEYVAHGQYNNKIKIKICPNNKNKLIMMKEINPYKNLQLKTNYGKKNK